MYAVCCPRRAFLPLSLAGAFVFAMVVVADNPSYLSQKRLRADESTSPVAGVRQLFFDDSGIESLDGLRRTMNPATKCPENPIIRNDRPWDAKRCQLHGTVIYRPDWKLYQMWYLAMADDKIEDYENYRLDGQPIISAATLVGYATSKDGVHWEKPSLGQCDFNGSRDNNLLKVGRVNREGFAVVYNPNDPDPQRLYRAIFWDHMVTPTTADEPPGRHTHVFNGRKMSYICPDLGDGMWVAFSPDGVHWTNYEKNPAAGVQSDSGQAVVWDSNLQKYVAYSRLGHGRLTARMESADFVTNWTKPQVVFQADADDGPNAEVEGFSLCIYEGKYVGLPWMRYNKEDVEWTTAIQLLYSDDGIQWNRVGNRQTFLGLGEPGSFDDTIIKLAHQPVVDDDRILIYYCGYDKYRGYQDSYRVQIGLATLRRDGWVSLDAGQQPGTLVTKPIVLPEGILHLNVDAAQGEARVALIDESGKLLAEAKPIQGDQLRAQAMWVADAPKPKGPVRLKFTMHDAKLYSYWFE